MTEDCLIRCISHLETIKSGANVAGGTKLDGGQKAVAMPFDEPTTALDPKMVNEVLDTVVGLARQVADRVIIMAKGEILEENTPEEFFPAAKPERARNVLGEILHH